ncbi:MAG TPA: outer membrane beta-barrel protein [Thermoanaerobaculia bacterium]|jgi:opacity protein-like surface antigen|nr:outer membrane beta-barrel protein [Thermoanaerobaculia bacterium]
MKLRAAFVLAAVASLLSLAAPALAQDDEEGRFAIGVGAGMVQTSGSSDPYFTANLRSRIGYRSAGDERQGSVFGFVEPEVGYWTRDNNGIESKDTLLGVNLGGAVRLRSFEYFIAGGVGYHMINRDVRTALGTRSLDDNSLGVNAQFGFDVRVTESVSLFGVGRFDLVQVDDKNSVTSSDKSPDDQQTKVYLGVRFHL